MSKMYLFAVIVSILSLIPGLKAADEVNNPEQPMVTSGKKIDRTIKMTEVFRITDESGDFFLKNPKRVRVAPDGSVFVMESSQVHLLKFSPQGKFITKMVQLGEGPGCLHNLLSYWIDSKEIIACGFMPVRVLCMDHMGKVSKEFRVNTNEFSYNFIGRYKDRYYFYIDPYGRTDDTGGVETIPNQLVAADEKGDVTKKDLILPVKVLKYTYKYKNEAGEVSITTKRATITRFIYALAAGRYLYASTDERYLVYLYDFDSDRIRVKFRRPYKPIPYKPNPNEEFLNSPEFRAQYKREFYNDIYHLLADGEQVWVLTSTVDKSKGILVDVFNLEGKYSDRFYLQIPRLEFPDDKVVNQLYLYNGFMYTIEMNAEDAPTIVKYKLEE